MGTKICLVNCFSSFLRLFYLQEWPKGLTNGTVRFLGADHIAAQYLNEVTAQIVDGVDPDRGETKLEGDDQVLLQVGVEGANLLGVDFAY